MQAPVDSMPPSIVIGPRGWTEEDRSRLMVDAVVELSLRARYENDTAFRGAANGLHHWRMIGGPACLQCMERVAIR